MFGGPEEIRTLDLSDANRTLYQLSYRPIYVIKKEKKNPNATCSGFWSG